jgi:hypothetical protein
VEDVFRVAAASSKAIRPTREGNTWIHIAGGMLALVRIRFSRIGQPKQSPPAATSHRTPFALGVTGTFSLILTVRGMWNLRRRA